ncbi:MAG: ParB/RepB/Spo0J family partition protein [Elusimicrobiota bacterium]
MRKALGRGLEELLRKTGEQASAAFDPTSIRSILIASITPNRFQPRKNIDPEKLSELSQSIKEHGLAQPILVSFDQSNNSYELVAGERRLRACQLAGMTHINAIVKNPKDDKERLAIALIENIQRDDLNAIETAHAYKRLMKEFSVSQTSLCQFVGKSKSSISNTLRLLDLPDEIQNSVQFGRLTEGHARALLMVAEPLERDKLFRLALDRKLSVRDVESLAQQIEQGKKLRSKRSGQEPRRFEKSADVRALEKELEQSLGTRVEIRTAVDQKKGRIIVHFYSIQEFDKIMKRLIK